MLKKVRTLQKLAKAGTANGRLARLEARVDYLTRVLGGLSPGLDVSITHTVDDRIVIDANGGGVGSVSVVNMAWLASLDTNGDGDPIVSHLGGTVTFFGGSGTTFQSAEYEIEEVGGEVQDAYCYLFWDASYNNGRGQWTREIEDAYPVEADMDDGDVFIPLWSLVDGALTQETVGAIIIPAIKNYVDADTTGELPQPAAQGGGE